MWGDITPEMMTEEETGTEDNYIRHRQSWRSSNFNKFMDKIDEKKNVKSLARQRQLGDEINRSPPSAAKSWMIKTDTVDESEDAVFDEHEHAGDDPFDNSEPI